MPIHPTLFIIGAFGPELAPLEERFRGQPRAELKPVGIGMVEAAIGTTELLAPLSTEERAQTGVVFVGSVGSVDPDVSIFDLVVTSAVVQMDFARAANAAYLPASAAARFDASEVLNAVFKGSAASKIYVEPVYSSPAVTRDETMSRQLALAAGARFENLELFGVAAACSRAGVLWTAVSAVTNYVGPDGHLEWLDNHLKAAEVTAEYLSTCVEKLRHALTKVLNPV